MARRRHRLHHAVRADGDEAVDARRAGCRLGAELARRHRRPSPRRCCRRSCGPAAASARSPAPRRSTRRRGRPRARSPRPCSGRAMLLVAGEIEHLRAVRAQRLADREQHRVAEPAADQQHGLAARRLGRRAGRAHQDHRLARRAASAQRSDEPPISSTMVESRPSSRSTDGAGQRQALHRQASCRRSARRRVSKFCRR